MTTRALHTLALYHINNHNTATTATTQAFIIGTVIALAIIATLVLALVIRTAYERAMNELYRQLGGGANISFMAIVRATITEIVWMVRR